MDSFLRDALIAGIGIALIAGPFGCFLIWRRMAYFGDTLAHSAFLGVGVSLLLGTHLSVSVFAVSALIALVLHGLERRAYLSTDTLLALLSHGTLALGLILLSFIPRRQVNIEGLLFGEILAVSGADIRLIWGGGVVLILALLLIWRPLVALTVSPALTAAEGRKVRIYALALTLLMAAFIALALKIIGALLITALLIIPAASARRLGAGSPERMAAIASLLGVLAVTGGVFGSLKFDTPSGPSIVVAALLVFVLTQLLRTGRGP